MKPIIFFGFILFTLSCSQPSSQPDENQTSASDTVNCYSLFVQAKQLDSTIMVANHLDPELGNKAIQAFSSYATHCKDSTWAPVYLFKAGQIAKAIHDIPKSKMYFEKCIDAYPNFANRPAVMFMLAQLYDEAGLLNNEDEARKIYEKIIFLYPNSEWSLAAQAAINNLGKTDEELIREFNQKNH